MQIHYFIFILIIIILIVFCVINQKGNNKKENLSIHEPFNPFLDYSRAYPGIFSYQFDYGYRPYWNSWPGNIRYNPSYWDYWYIPAHEYLDNWMNGNRFFPNIYPDGYIIPPLTNQDCVNQEIQKTGNLDLSIYKCTVPATIAGSCPKTRNFGR